MQPDCKHFALCSFLPSTFSSLLRFAVQCSYLTGITIHRVHFMLQFPLVGPRRGEAKALWLHPHGCWQFKIILCTCNIISINILVSHCGDFLVVCMLLKFVPDNFSGKGINSDDHSKNQCLLQLPCSPAVRVRMAFYFL